MDTVTVTFVDPDGEEHVIDNAETGESLMKVARENDIEGIQGDCGGACSCGTCHVFVDPAWMEKVGPPDDVEFDMLDMFSDETRDNSRLSCQIILSANLNGLKVTVVPLDA